MPNAKPRIHLSLLVLTLLAASGAAAMPPYLVAWEAKYPTSTIPSRMATLTGSACNTCHHPPQRYYAGSCYREAIRQLLDSGMEIGQALDAVDGLDSDGDGIPNGVEILTPRADLPGEVGYHPGLIGPTGTDPCYDDPDEIVTGISETPPTACPADLDGDGVVDFPDYLVFLNLYDADDPGADLDADGVVDFADFLDFLNHYDAGC